MRLRLVSAIVGAAAAFALSACQPTPGTGAPPASPTTAGPTGAATTGPAPPPPPTSEPTGAGLEYRVSYNWAVPSREVVVNHPLVAPIAPPPALPLPHLVAIYVGDHPEATPAYQRISFYFRGAFPSYNFRYVPSVLSEGQGTAIPLEGNAALRVGFVDAQAHDNSGASTVRSSPRNPIGFRNLKSYGFAGDFEGHVTYGLGIQVAPGSDQALRIRAGELKKPDGSGGFYYVVHFDVENA
jgi:hypothetical protein